MDPIRDIWHFWPLVSVQTHFPSLLLTDFFFFTFLQSRFQYKFPLLSRVGFFQKYHDSDKLYPREWISSDPLVLKKTTEWDKTIYLTFVLTEDHPTTRVGRDATRVKIVRFVLQRAKISKVVLVWYNRSPSKLSLDFFTHARTRTQVRVKINQLWIVTTYNGHRTKRSVRLFTQRGSHLLTDKLKYKLVPSLNDWSISVLGQTSQRYCMPLSEDPYDATRHFNRLSICYIDNTNGTWHRKWCSVLHREEETEEGSPVRRHEWSEEVHRDNTGGAHFLPERC